MDELGLPIPKTHDLELLLPNLISAHPSLKSIRRGAAFLSNFAVGTRYPGENASKRQAIAAVRWCDRTRSLARGFLGIPPPRRGGNK
jgi:hypothetical protein